VLQAALTKQTVGSYDEEYRIMRPDGSIRWIRDRAFPVQDSAGSVTRIVGVADVITDRKRAEEELQRIHHELEHRGEERTAALQASQERLEMAFHGAGLASWDWHIESGSFSFNERWAELRGFLARELAPQISSSTDGIHPDDRPVVASNLKA